MSTTRLLILGMVRWAQPVHGYEVRRELLSWNAEEWANVAPGSIYHALRKLTADGLLRTVGTEQVGGRPARTRYEMTDDGQRVFYELLREYWWEIKPVIDPFLAAFANLDALSRREASAALRNRARMLRGHAEGMRIAVKDGWMSADTPPHVAEMFELWIVRAEADLAWCERVAKRVEAGELDFPGSNNQS